MAGDAAEWGCGVVGTTGASIVGGWDSILGEDTSRSLPPSSQCSFARTERGSETGDVSKGSASLEFQLGIVLEDGQQKLGSSVPLRSAGREALVS